ncbi:hypothetical protein BpHYR1_012876 [Brachionus plicatilis]|uniref:Uncharacterized protein n=1 Tax=Brachionus plicatilis TaxID=10195 RepID=A0A3M7QFZ3_BRAPC|nr:hypothetical protein BpHYR1_012876 [Brachionus plicatilis]
MFAGLVEQMISKDKLDNLLINKSLKNFLSAFEAFLANKIKKKQIEKKLIMVFLNLWKFRQFLFRPEKIFSNKKKLKKSVCAKSRKKKFQTIFSRMFIISVMPNMVLMERLNACTLAGFVGPPIQLVS